MSPRDLFFVTVLLGLAYECVRRLYPATPTSTRLWFSDALQNILLHRWTTPLAACALVFLFILRLALIQRAALDVHTPPWLLHLPIIALYDALSLRYTFYRQSISLALALISIASSATLYLIYRSLEAEPVRRGNWIAVSIAHAALILCALYAPAMASTDAYFYAAYEELGAHAYASQAVSLPCPASPPSEGCMEPQVPAVYGPLYLFYLHALLNHAHAVGARIAILRFSNVLWLEILIALLACLKLELRLLAVFALNIPIFAQYVGDAHNDIIPIAALLAATLCAMRRLPYIALVLCAAASLIKLPFAVLGTLVFLRSSLPSRWAWASASVLLCAALSWLWGGRPYMESLAYYSRFHQAVMSVPHWLAAVAALGVILLAIARAEVSFPGAFALSALAGGSAFPWYALWALPYLQWDHTKLRVFLITLPMTSFLMETPFQIPALWLALTALLITTIISAILTPRRLSETPPAR